MTRARCMPDAYAALAEAVRRMCAEEGRPEPASRGLPPPTLTAREYLERTDREPVRRPRLGVAAGKFRAINPDADLDARVERLLTGEPDIY